MRIKSKIKLEKWMPFIVFFLLSIPLLFRCIGSGDELWNYNFAINVSRGKLPYADFNIVPTPLSAYFSAFFLLVFGNSLIVFRLAGVFVIASVFALLYSICKKISNNSTIAMIASAFLFILVYPIWIYNYNNLNLLMVMLVIYLEIKSDFKYRRHLISLIYGIIPIIKQSTGVALLSVYFVLIIFDVIEKRLSKKESFVQLVITLFPGIVFVISLFILGIFQDFWEYAVQGISTFVHRIFIWEFILSNLLAFIITIFMLTTIVLSVIRLVKGKSKIQKNIHLRIFLVSLAAGMVAYPLTDYVHMIIALVPYVISFVCCFNYGEYTKAQQRICIFIVAEVLVISLLMGISNMPEYTISELNHFEGVPVDKRFETKVKTINDFILEK